MIDLTCKELIDQLDAYVDGSMPADQRTALDAHFAICTACVAYLKNYRQTIAMGQAVFKDTNAPVPPEVPKDLLNAILASRKKG